MKNLTTEITEFHGVVDTKIIFSPCYSAYSVVFYSGLPRAISKRYSEAGAGRLKKQVGESGLKSASVRILSLGVFSAKKLHLKQ